MKMTRAGLLGMAMLSWAVPAWAVESCTQVRIAMVPFREAEFSAPIIWKSAAGERAIENLSDAIALDDKSVIAGGYYAPAAEPGKVQPYLMRMERRGKVLWQVRGESKTAQKHVRMARDGEEFVVLSATQGAGEAGMRRIDVTRYDLDGKRIEAFSLSESDGHLDPSAIIPTKEGYYIAARYTNRKVPGQRFGVLYRMDKTGKREWRRAYIPGLNTTIDDMIRLKNGDLLFSGMLTSRDGRQSGWLLRTDNLGGIKWQKSYPRGRASELAAASEAYDGSGYILSGTSWPGDGGTRPAAWAMKVDSGGDMIWERFFSGADEYHGLGIASLEDGRSVSLISALPAVVAEGQYAHARLMALSPRGDLLEADSFTDGDGLWPSRLLQAGGQPLLIGSVREIPPDPPADKKPPPPPPPVSYDGWVGELQTFSSYDDPCANQ